MSMSSCIRRAAEITGDWIRRCRRLPLHYRKNDFARRLKYQPAYPPLADSLVKHLDFETVLDLGCGNGFLLAPLVGAGKAARGIELSADVRDALPENIRGLVDIGDFAESSGKYDLVCCVEVAEHIVSSRSIELVRTVCARAKKWAYFSAAPPGQWGRGHINCRPQKDWIGWFEREGWTYDNALTQLIRADLQSLHKARWLRRNGMVFRPAGEGKANP